MRKKASVIVFLIFLIPLLSIASSMARPILPYWFDLLFFVVMLLFGIFIYIGNAFKFPIYFDYFYVAIISYFILKNLFKKRYEIRLIIKTFFAFLFLYLIFRVLANAIYLGTMTLYYRYQIALIIFFQCISMLIISFVKLRKKSIKLILLITLIIIPIIVGISIKNQTNFGPPTLFYFITILFSLFWFYGIWNIRHCISSIISMRAIKWLLLTILWFCGLILFLYPDFITTYATYRYSKPYLYWVVNNTKNEDIYDIIVTDKGQYILAAVKKTGLVAYQQKDNKNFFLFNKNRIKSFMNIQRFDIDEKRKLIYAATYTSDKNNANYDIIVFDFLLNQISGFKYNECIFPIYVRYNKMYDSVYYSCENSGHIIQYDIDKKNFKLLGKIIMPNVVQISPDNNYLYVAGLAEPKLYRFNLKTGRLDKHCYIGPATLGIIQNPIDKDIYASSFLLGQVYIIDGENFKVKDKIQVGLGARDIDLNLSSKKLFVGNWFFGTMSIVDLSTGQKTEVFTGPLVRGVYYDKETDRIYFCSKLGIGYYKTSQLPSLGEKSKILEESLNLLKAIVNSEKRRELLQFLSLFRAYLRLG